MFKIVPARIGILLTSAAWLTVLSPRLASADPTRASQGMIRRANPVAGEYLVVAAVPGTSSAARASVLADLEVLLNQVGGKILSRWSRVLFGFHVRMDESAAVAISESPLVKYVQENSASTRGATTQSGPANWGIDRIDQRDLPLGSAYTYTYAGNGVHAYIVDSGIRSTHTEFTGRIGVGNDAIQDGNGTDDCTSVGHGTGVASIVGGTTLGVAKGVWIHPVRVLDCNNHGTSAQVVNGLHWVAENAVFPAVANLSLVSDGIDTALEDAIWDLIGAGVTVVIAAGNGYGTDVCGVSPARVSGAITVGETNSADYRTSETNIGSCLDVFAPGWAVNAASNTSDSATHDVVERPFPRHMSVGLWRSTCKLWAVAGA